MIYKLNNQYYIKQGNLYYLADISHKKHTVVVTASDVYVEKLEGAKEISYNELKKEEMING